MRFCIFCENNKLDDEFHFLLECSELSNFRKLNSCDTKFNKCYTFHNIHKQNIDARRPSGGISVLIRSNLRKSATGKEGVICINENEYTISMKLCKHISTLKRICTYVQPTSPLKIQVSININPIVIPS